MSAGNLTGFDPALSRRSFLQSMGGLVVAFNLFGRAAAAAGAEPSSAFPAAGNLDAWLAVRPDNTATLFTGKVETGTGVQTALAQFAAEELDFPFERLDVVMGTTSMTVDQGPTYGSMTIRYAGPQIRHAAAAGRQALLDLAARHFDVPVSQLVELLADDLATRHELHGWCARASHELVWHDDQPPRWSFLVRRAH